MLSDDMSTHSVMHWVEDGEERSARWFSESGAPPAARVVTADEHLTADRAYGLACQGTALLTVLDPVHDRVCAHVVGQH